MDAEKVKKAVLRLRAAMGTLSTELTAAMRELDEALEETPTVRPPSQTAMQAVRVPIIEVVQPGRSRPR